MSAYQIVVTLGIQNIEKNKKVIRKHMVKYIYFCDCTHIYTIVGIRYNL